MVCVCDYLAIVLLLVCLAPYFLLLLFVLLIVNLLLLCSALRIAENSKILRITRETQGKIWTNTTRNLRNQVSMISILMMKILTTRMI